jgi:hypothetical protein
MYEVGTPLAGGAAAAGALAYTGAETVSVAVLGTTLLLAGLVALRVAILRRKHRHASDDAAE